MGGGVQSCDFGYHRFLVILKIFAVLCSQNFVCKLDLSLSNIFSKKPMKIAFIHDFLRKKINFCLYFTHKMTISRFLRACPIYDVIVTSYIYGWYLFWYQWKEDIHSYTLVVNLGLYDLPSSL